MTRDDPSPIQRIDDALLDAHDVRLWLKRDDLVGGDVPGNKRRKLKYLLSDAGRRGDRTILTFGGAYSNHLRAVAAAGRAEGLATIGVVRGEEHLPLNWSLARAVEDGMVLHYLDRATYRRATDPDVIAALHGRFGDFRLVPEGGSGALAVPGCAELAAEIRRQVDADIIVCPVGTGGTLAGIAAGLGPGQAALGFCVLRGFGFLDDVVAELHSAARVSAGQWKIVYGHHHGGYARRDPALDAFIDQFRDRHGIELDWIYVAKALSGLYSLIRAGELDGQRVVAVVTGPATPLTDQPGSP